MSEAHPFGEFGTGFWQPLLRFELHDDRLRLQHVEQQERNAFFSEINQAMETAQQIAAGDPGARLLRTNRWRPEASCR